MLWYTNTKDKHINIDVFCISADIHGRMDEHLGNMGVTMDGRFSQIRARETNLGIYSKTSMARTRLEP